jgi:hypothetical protein
MLQRRALYFCRADRLTDPYEGYITRRMADPAVLIDAVRVAYDQEGKEFGEKELRMVEGAAAANIDFARLARKSFYVNCWHASRYESLAMWKLYTSMSDAICIRSTYRQLWDCLPEKQCYLGEVKYIDYERDGFEPNNILNQIMHKRASSPTNRKCAPLCGTRPTCLRQISKLKRN